MKTKYHVTDSRGAVHTRTSERTYTHAVVCHMPPRPERNGLPAREEKTYAAWSGTPRLAEREANRWRNSPAGWTVEVIEAKVSPAKMVGREVRDLRESGEV